MTNPLDGRNTKKPNTKTADFFRKHSYFSQIFSKKAKITLSFLEKNPKITILFWVLVFSFMYLVSADAKDRSK